MARNMPIPEVTADKEGNLPYVMASTYPNGATAITTEPRVTDARKVWYPRAEVTAKIHDASKVIGIAGHYGTLTLEFATPVRVKSVAERSQLFHAVVRRAANGRR